MSRAERAARGAAGPGEREGLRARYRRLCNRRGQDAWSILFGYPLGRLLLVWLERIEPLRPTHLTLASILVRLAGAWLLVDGATVAAVIALQLGQVLDSMDGTLARARGQHSAPGALLDRAGDALCLGLIAAAVGWRAGDEAALAAALGGAFLHLLRGYMHWVARGVAAPGSSAARAAEPVSGARPAGDPPRPLREWLAGLPRLALFGEADLYLWISIGALAGLWRETALLLLASQAIAAAALLVHHAARLARG